MDKKNFNTLKNKIYNVDIGFGKITEVLFCPAETAHISDDGIPIRDVPERVDVYLTLKPTERSDIKVIVSLPTGKWNGKLLGLGNGGDAGRLNMSAVKSGVARNFAVTHTDLGTGDRDLYGKRECLIDFGYRATHLMTEAAKAIVKSFYGTDAKRSYFVGGSTGGQQALSEVQRYPDDYDGVVAIAPAYDRVAIHQAFAWYMQCTCGGVSFTREQLSAIKAKIVEKFAVPSGSAPGDLFISYPGKIGAINVSETFAELGFTESQLDVLSKLYTVPRAEGEEIFSPLPIGCEQPTLFIPYMKEFYWGGLSFLHRWTYGNDFDPMKFDIEKGYVCMNNELGELNATQSNIAPFKAKGGKLILVSGSEDFLIHYDNTQKYYKAVINSMGGLDHTTDFCRYFHVPGLGHCTAGSGLQEIGSLLGISTVPLGRENDVLDAVVAWVEEGIAPDVIYPKAFIDGDMKKGVSYERPVYPYPYETVYVGGDRTDKRSFDKKLGNGNY